MKSSWSLSVRTWLTIVLIAVVLTPLVAWVGTIVAFRGPMKTRQTPWEFQTRAALQEADLLIQARRADWNSPAFQQTLLPLLQRGRVTAALFDAQGRPIFVSDDSFYPSYIYPTPRVPATVPYGLIRQTPPAAANQLLTGLGKQYLGKQYLGMTRDPSGALSGIYLLVEKAGDPLVPWLLGAAVLGLTAAMALVVWWVGRSLNRPVLDLSRRARLVNQGQLEFDLPQSRVRELNDLAGAFGAMRDGLQSSLIQQAAMEEERRMFIAAVAHDLRTPLTSVRGYLEGLRDGVAHTPEKVERYVAVALEKTGHLERLIADLFAYARTEYLSQPPQRERLDLGVLLAATADGLRPQAEAKGITLGLAAGPEPVLLAGDRLMLGRVVDNLLDNAIRYTPPGGSVTLGWHGMPDECRFWVQDTGPGISPEGLPRVFQPLYRGDKARSTRTGGAGLGLAIARRLVDAHGGNIAVTNQDGGARFTVTLPRASGMHLSDLPPPSCSTEMLG
ncbi:MAG TPA: HAMP domain-containing sensor histidine kinase [Symbiobacteriaceae bacterium]